MTEIGTGKLLRRLKGHFRTIWALAFPPNNSALLAGGCLAGQIRVWDLRVTKHPPPPPVSQLIAM
ncbi:MAG: hypothetical protein GY820_08310 [Gammaproteobacteria bacterium]|nr:hypothetical protein [Gammaproteobacteria bacterium]